MATSVIYRTIRRVPEHQRGRAARQKIMRELLRREAEEDDPPTVRELAEATGISHGSTEHHLEKLVIAGWVAHKPGAQRSWRLTPAGRAQVQ